MLNDTLKPTRWTPLHLKNGWGQAQRYASQAVHTKPSTFSDVKIRRGGNEHALPVEILERIFSNLKPRIVQVEGNCGHCTHENCITSQPTLRSATLVCRTWCAVATKYLYKEPFITTLKGADVLYATLCANSGFPALVKHIHIFDHTISHKDIPHRDDLVADFREERDLYETLWRLLPDRRAELPKPQSLGESDAARMADRAVQIAEKCFGASKGKAKALPRTALQVKEINLPESSGMTYIFMTESECFEAFN